MFGLSKAGAVGGRGVLTPAYGRMPKHTAPVNVNSVVMAETLRGKTVFNSTAREDASPDFSCGLSYIADNGRALCGDTLIHSSVSTLKATEFRQWESPVKIFARMKAKVSNQNTPKKSSVVREELPPPHGLVQSDMYLETMDIEQHSPSVDDTEALTLSPPNSPGGSPPEINRGELDEELQRVQYNVNVSKQSAPAEALDGVGDSEKLLNRCHVLLERLPDTQSPAKIFATLKKTLGLRLQKPNLLKQTQENRENVMAMEPSMGMFVDEKDHIPNEEGVACSDGSALPTSANGKHTFVRPRVYSSTEPKCMDDSMLFGSPRLTIPQKKKAADSDLTVKLEKHDPRMIEGIQLKDWVLKLSDGKLYVDGKRVDLKTPWHSNTIVERIASNVLKTVSGRTYILVGKMSTKYPSELPSTFQKKFLYGFPKMWETYLQDYLKERKNLDKEKPGNAFVPTKRKELPRTDKLLSSQSPNATPPANSQVNSQKVSRSGRVIKSPLEYWRGGRVMVDLDLNVTVFEDYSVMQTPTGRARKEPQQKQSAKKSTVIQKEFCPSTSSQDEDGVNLVRKAKPYQRPRRLHSRDRATSQTQEKSLFAVPQTREEFPNESVQTLPRRSSRRSASISPPAGQDQTSPDVGVFQNKAGVSVKARGRGSKRSGPSQQRTSASSDAVKPTLTTNQGPRLKSKSRSSSEDCRRSGRKRSSPPVVGSQSEPTTTVACRLPSPNTEQVMGPPKRKGRPKKDQKNKLPSVSDSDAEVFSDPVFNQESNSQRRKPSSKRRIENREELYDSKRADEELRKRKNAVSSLPEHMPTFWDSVTSKVGSQSPEKCQEEHSAPKQSGHAPQHRAKPKKKTKEKAVKEVPQITARAGTLRRKQQIREVLDYLPKDGYDDAFSSSPMQKRLKKLPTFTDGEEDDPLSQPMTPKTPTSGMLVSVKTPTCMHISPSMFPSINRNQNDKYVFRCQKEMKRGQKGRGKAPAKSDQKNYTPSPLQKTEKTCVAEDDSFVVWEMFTQKEAQSPQSDDSEQDHYFSDSDN